jgi:hypothetical protein
MDISLITANPLIGAAFGRRDIAARRQAETCQAPGLFLKYQPGSIRRDAERQSSLGGYLGSIAATFHLRGGGLLPHVG